MQLLTTSGLRRGREERVTTTVLLLTSALTAGLYGLLWIAS
jgi:hypothetical protein